MGRLHQVAYVFHCRFIIAKYMLKPEIHLLILEGFLNLPYLSLRNYLTILNEPFHTVLFHGLSHFYEDNPIILATGLFTNAFSIILT